MRYVDGAEVRAFCVDRYRWSLRLPEIIQRAATGRAFFSEPRNYLFRDQIEGVDGDYAVFFNVQRAKRPPVDVRLFVVSAYVKPPKRLERISFATLVSNTARGVAIRRPQK